jgi:hypothetical protein
MVVPLAQGMLCQRETVPLYARTYTSSSMTPDQIQVGVPGVVPSSR